MKPVLHNFLVHLMGEVNIHGNQFFSSVSSVFSVFSVAN